VLQLNYSYIRIMTFSAKTIAERIGGEIIGDPNSVVDKLQGIESAEASAVTFLSNPRYKTFLNKTHAGVIIIPNDLSADLKSEKTYIKVKNVQLSVQQLSSIFKKNLTNAQFISENASVAQDVTLGENVGIGRYTIVELGSTIGNHTNIKAQVFIGKHVTIGSDCLIYPGVKIYDNTVIGDRVIIHSNAVIGTDGFGYVKTGEGMMKIEHLGNVIIEDDVEVGSNTVIDKASMGSTVIKKGVKLDNLIQIGHNVELGNNTVIAAQSGVSGSTKIGKNCMVGGQVGFAGHIEIAEGSQIQAKSGISSTITKKNAKWYGYPAIGYYKYLRSFAFFKRLPMLFNELTSLRKEIDHLRKDKNQH